MKKGNRPDRSGNISGNTKRNGNTRSEKANDAVRAYREGGSPLGSYTGLTNAMNFPGRNFFPETQHVDMPLADEGKLYLPEDELPVQDADDL